MSRDKCGAAAVAGFLKTVSLLAPKHVNITAGLSLVRNSIGSDSYVSDEVLYSRNGTRGKSYANNFNGLLLISNANNILWL
jgi:leucyl aminopeptidase